MSLLFRIPSVLPKSIFAVSVACLGFTQQTDAGVTWLVSDTPGGLVLSTDGGSFDGGSVFDDSGNTADVGYYQQDSDAVYVLRPLYRISATVGITHGDPWLNINTGNTSSSPGSSSSGHSFGHTAGRLVWDPVFGDSPGEFIPISTMTFADLSVADAFGTNLNNGPVLLWTHDTTNDFIAVGFTSYVVPEPSSSVLLGLGSLALLLRRRR